MIALHISYNAGIIGIFIYYIPSMLLQTCLEKFKMKLLPCNRLMQVLIILPFYEGGGGNSSH